MFIQITSLCLLFALSFLAYKGLERMKFPASRLVGPIVLIAILQAGFGWSFSVPTALKTLFSVVFGVYLGLRFHKKALHRLKQSLVPALLISFIYLFITIAYGQIIQMVSSVDQTSAFLAVIPGGIAEASILAVSYNANLAQVSSFQLVRFLSIVLIVPLITQWILVPKLRKEKHPVPTNALNAEKEDIDLEQAITPHEVSRENPPYPWLILFVIGAMGSYLFKCVHFPAALLLGATFAVSAFTLASKRETKTPPAIFYNLAQVGMGTVIGTSFTKESVASMGELILPMAILTVLVLSTSYLLGLLFMKLFRLDFLTAFMAVLPGGMSAMVVLADEFGADVVMISSLQLVRLITAVMIIPILYQSFL